MGIFLDEIYICIHISSMIELANIVHRKNITRNLVILCCTYMYIQPDYVQNEQRHLHRFYF